MQCISKQNQNVITDLTIMKREDLLARWNKLSILLSPASCKNNDMIFPVLSRDVPMKIKRRGIEMKLVIESDTVSRVDPVLIRIIARARLWFEELQTGVAKSNRDIARRYNVNESYVGNLMPLAFLAPDIVEAIMAGQQPADLTADALIKRIKLPLDWTEQRQVLGFN